VQCAIIAAFNDHPNRRFEIAELASLAYPGVAIEDKHCQSVRRAMSKVAPKLGLTKFHASRSRSGETRWRHNWGR
jgi:hypothetical protein